MKTLDTIQKICDEYDIKAYEIAKNTSLSATGVQKIIDGTVKKPHQSTIDKILNYVESKIVNTNKVSEPLKNYNPQITPDGVPYYAVDFVSGYDTLINNQTLRPEYKISYKPYNNADFWVDNIGHSMAPKIENGDIVALKTLNDITQIMFGEVYAIVMPEMRTIKYIRKSNLENHFLFVPENTVDFDEQDFKLDLIQKIFIVLGSIKKFF